jgi:hypothetical protein
MIHQTPLYGRCHESYQTLWFFFLTNIFFSLYIYIQVKFSSKIHKKNAVSSEIYCNMYHKIAEVNASYILKWHTCALLLEFLLMRIFDICHHFDTKRIFVIALNQTFAIPKMKQKDFIRIFCICQLLMLNCFSRN